VENIADERQSLPKAASGVYNLAPLRSNFQDEYLPLGLWPEMSYEKQALLRKQYRMG